MDNTNLPIRKTKPGVPSNIPEQYQNASTNKVETVDRDVNAWWNKPDVDDKIDAYVKEHGNNEPISGAQGTIARGNQGDNAIKNPDAPDTREVTKRHNEELSSLQTPEDMSPAVGSIKTKTSDVEKLGDNAEGSVEAEPKAEGGKTPRDYSEYYSDFDELIDKYDAPKSGAEMLKQLWGQGAGGKAAAIGNVLGNLMGAVGKGAAGKEYKSDWETYRDNYITEQNRRNQEAFNQNMDIIKQARDNDVKLDNTGKMIDYYEKLGDKASAEKMAKVRKAMTMAGKNGWTDYAVSSLIGEFAQDEAFVNTLKNAVSEGVDGAKEILGLLSGTISTINNRFANPWGGQ